MNKITLSACVAGLFAVAPLFAQSDVNQKLSVGASFYGEADVDSSGVGAAAGKAESQRFDFGIKLNDDYGNRQSWTAGIHYQYDTLDFSNATGFTPSNDLQIIEVLLKWELKPAEGEKLGYMAMITPKFGKESSGDFLDGMHGGIGGGVTYRVSDTLSITGGLLYNHRLEDDAWFLPIISINWQVTDLFRIYTFNGVFAEYALSEDRRQVIDAGLSYETSAYNTGSSNSVIAAAGFPGDNDGAILAREIPLEVGYTYNFTEHFGMRVSGAWIFESTHEYFVNDNEYREDDFDDTWRLGLSIIGRY